MSQLKHFTSESRQVQSVTKMFTRLLGSVTLHDMYHQLLLSIVDSVFNLLGKYIYCTAPPPLTLLSSGLNSRE